MQIVKTGTKIITISGQIKAIVTGVCIRNESINYEISYFGGGEHKSAGLAKGELPHKLATKNRTKVLLK